MKRMLAVLNSRSSAVLALALVVLFLFISTFFPNHFTLGHEAWLELQRTRPLLHSFASRLSTPYLVGQWWFLALAFFMFLSTLSCTIARLVRWVESRTSEPYRDRAFSFSMTVPVSGTDRIRREAERLKGEGWKCTAASACGAVMAEKGLGLGFWGSLIFHTGLVVAFLAFPLTAIDGYRGTLILTEGSVLPLQDAVNTSGKGGNGSLPAVAVGVEKLRGVYSAGKFKVDFGGILFFDFDGKRSPFPFSVNQPVEYQGYQFSLQEYGYSPRVIFEERGGRRFDYFLNLLNPEKGDFFMWGDRRKLEVRMFPDFFREGELMGTRSMDLRNPVVLIRILDPSSTPVDVLVKPGRKVPIGDYTLEVPEIGKWVSLAVTRDRGVLVIIVAALVCVVGLSVRFLSNERRLELSFIDSEGGSEVAIRGYSRYYPAFLEREVRHIGDRMAGEGEHDG